MHNLQPAGIQHLEPGAALAALASSPQGLSGAEAARRLAEYGPNRVEEVPREHVAWRVGRHFLHFFAIILWLAAALAFVAERFQPGAGMALLGYAILAVILLNGLFSWAQEHRAEHALAALCRMLPATVEVLRDGVVRELALAEVVPGDVLLLEGGDDVPADCRLIVARGVRVNTATVTGESLPRARSAEADRTEDPLEARNVLLAGTSLVAGEATAVVFATGRHTEFGRIARLAQATDRGNSPLQREIARLSRWIALLATTLGVVFFALGIASGVPFWGSLLFAIGIIVANVPEGLLPTVTLALAMGAQRMARRNALIRHLPSVETLGATTVICTDKTGTLTENRLRVCAVYADGAERQPDARAPHAGALLEVAANCHTLRADAETAAWRGDPLEVALAQWAARLGARAGELERLDEVPFDSERRRMSTLHRAPGGEVLLVKGALESVLPLCDAVLEGGSARTLDEHGRRNVRDAEERLARRGHRVIALARREREAGAPLGEEDERGLTLLGLLALEDPVREQVPAAIAACHGAGIRVIMVTGDHPRTALAVARSIGLVRGPEPRVIAGARLARMGASELQLALDHPEIVFARISADQKRRIVEALKRKGDTVAATGDGVNDAPALREADIGIAMGRSGTDVARASADMVLLDDDFASIVAAIEEGRGVFDNIRKFLTYILSSNVPEAVPYLAFVLLGIPLPLTVIQILAVDLGTDMLPALALGAEAPDRGVMHRPPRPRTQRLVDRALLLRAYLWLGLFEAAAAMTAYFAVLFAGGWHWGQALGPHDPLYLQATTACFGAIVVMQMANVLACRSEHRPLLGRAGLALPRLVLAGLAVEAFVLAAIVWTPWGNALFATAPPPPLAWLAVLPFAAAMLLAEELRKRLVHPGGSRG